VRTPVAEDKPVEQTEAAPQEQAKSTEGVSIELITSNWRAILASVKGKNTATGGFLDSAEPVDWRDNVLTLSFPQSAGFARHMCKDRAEQVESLLSEAIGTRIKVQFESSAAQSDETQATGQAKADRKKRDEALNDPAVRTLLSGLNATVTGIDKVEE
jgi:chromosomal replication initiation ATPase DnaA